MESLVLSMLLFDAAGVAILQTKGEVGPLDPLTRSGLEKASAMLDVWPLPHNAYSGWNWASDGGCSGDAWNVMWARDTWNRIKDWPRLEELNRMPSHEIATLNYEAAYGAWVYLEQTRLYYGGRERQMLDELTAAQRWRYQVWAAIRWATISRIGHSQRQELDDLRRLMGWPAFYAGEWPSPVE